MTGFCCSPYRINKGFTLVELMVAMVLGAFFLNGLLQIFSSSKQTYRTQENLARLQENGRFAIDFISQDVRMAGYWGCSPKAPSIAGFSNPNIFFYDLKTALEGFEATTATHAPTTTSVTAWTPPLPTLDTPFDITSPDNVLEGSDVLVVRRVNAQGLLVDKSAIAKSPLKLDAHSDKLIQAGITTEAIKNKGSLVAIVTNCTETEAFQITDLAGSSIGHVIVADTPATDNKVGLTPGNDKDSLSIMLTGAKVHAVDTVSYYIATNRNSEKLLYRRTNAATTEELVDGVEQMQILYGVDTATDDDSSPNYYVPADKVNLNGMNWNNVVSVRVSLLLATLDNNVADHPLPYTFNRETKTPEDRKIRRVFTSTIAIRNRLK